MSDDELHDAIYKCVYAAILTMGDKVKGMSCFLPNWNFGPRR